MEPEPPNPPRPTDGRLAKDVQQERALLRNVVHLSLWTLVALTATMILLLADMSLPWRVFTAVLTLLFWGFAVAGMFRLAGLLDSGRRSVSFNPFHAADRDDKAGK